MADNGTARIWQRRYANILRLTDFVAIGIAVFGSQFIRFGVDSHEVLASPFELNIYYTAISIALTGFWLASLSFYGTRDHKIIGTGSTEYRRLTDATARCFGLVAITMYLFRLELGRGYFLLALPLGFILLTAGRWGWRKWLIAKRRKGEYVHRTLLVGQRLKNVHVAEQILHGSGGAAGLLPVGALTGLGSSDRELLPGIPVLGSFTDVVSAVKSTNADTVVLTGADDISPRDMRELGWSLETLNVSLVVAPALTDVAGPRIHARQVAGLPLIHVDYPSFEGYRHSAKRFFDVLAASAALVALSVVLIGIAVAVRRNSPGPALFSQERVGLNGKTFHMLKFRSMVVDAEDLLPGLLDASEGNGVMFKMKRDPRITSVGAFLRRYSLDELPQLVNVLKGDMSLVGPRPPLAREVEQYNKWEHRRFLVKPGITGLWQVSGRSDLSWEDSVRLDLYYVENWSLAGDLIIVYRTVKTVVSPDGAY
jgi:exopolysaccharide biosynthesis polyprenyl glycosylphosphotransferase